VFPARAEQRLFVVTTERAGGLPPDNKTVNQAFGGIHMNAYRTVKKGFTLIEILIVVIILGILAAIVIPQFTNASTQAKQSALDSTVQTLRSQIALYRLQHGDTLPDLTVNWAPLTGVTAYGGQNWGPYMQATPVNSLTNGSVVKNGTGAAAVPGCDFIYDYNANAGSGNIWGTLTTAGGVVAP
jgi:general secretion pathway protein G